LPACRLSAAAHIAIQNSPSALARAMAFREGISMPTRVLAVVVLAIGTTLCPAAAQTIEDQDARPILVRSGPERGVAQRPLNVRNGPGRTHRKIAEFSRGSELVFLTPPGCYDGYCFVQGPRSVRGWVLAEAVRKQQKG